jgi:two-component system sensor histidine kinase FlrB
VPLDAVVQEVAQIIEPQLAAGGLRFEREFVAPGVAVRGDRKALTGALLNLLENALQVTPAGGTVRLSGGVQADIATVQVEDNGPGMEPDIKLRIFEPFFTTRQEGTGLGLAIVRSVAQAHGGEVEVSSTPGQGSVFSLHLPIARIAA